MKVKRNNILKFLLILGIGSLFGASEVQAMAWLPRFLKTEKQITNETIDTILNTLHKLDPTQTIKNLIEVYTAVKNNSADDLSFTATPTLAHSWPKLKNPSPALQSLFQKTTDAYQLFLENKHSEMKSILTQALASANELHRKKEEMSDLAFSEKDKPNLTLYDINQIWNYLTKEQQDTIETNQKKIQDIAIKLGAAQSQLLINEFETAKKNIADILQDMIPKIEFKKQTTQKLESYKQAIVQKENVLSNQQLAEAKTTWKKIKTELEGKAILSLSSSLQTEISQQLNALQEIIKLPIELEKEKSTLEKEKTTKRNKEIKKLSADIDKQNTQLKKLEKEAKELNLELEAQEEIRKVIRDEKLKKGELIVQSAPELVRINNTKRKIKEVNIAIEKIKKEMTSYKEDIDFLKAQDALDDVLIPLFNERFNNLSDDQKNEAVKLKNELADLTEKKDDFINNKKTFSEKKKAFVYLLITKKEKEIFEQEKARTELGRIGKEVKAKEAEVKGIQEQLLRTAIHQEVASIERRLIEEEGGREVPGAGLEDLPDFEERETEAAAEEEQRIRELQKQQQLEQKLAEEKEALIKMQAQEAREAAKIKKKEERKNLTEKLAKIIEKANKIKLEFESEGSDPIYITYITPAIAELEDAKPVANIQELKTLSEFYSLFIGSINHLATIDITLRKLEHDKEEVLTKGDLKQIEQFFEKKLLYDGELAKTDQNNLDKLRRLRLGIVKLFDDTQSLANKFAPMEIDPEERGAITQAITRFIETPLRKAADSPTQSLERAAEKLAETGKSVTETGKSISKTGEHIRETTQTTKDLYQQIREDIMSGAKKAGYGAGGLLGLYLLYKAAQQPTSWWPTSLPQLRSPITLPTPGK